MAIEELLRQLFAIPDNLQWKKEIPMHPRLCLIKKKKGKKYYHKHSRVTWERSKWTQKKGKKERKETWYKNYK